MDAKKEGCQDLKEGDWNLKNEDPEKENSKVGDKVSTRALTSEKSRLLAWVM